MGRRKSFRLSAGARRVIERKRQRLAQYEADVRQERFGTKQESAEERLVRRRRMAAYVKGRERVRKSLE